MDTVTICVSLVLVVVLLGVVITYRRRHHSAADTIAVDILALHDIVQFFKRTEVSEKLRSGQNTIAVALKGKGVKGRTRIVLCTYDKALSKVCEPLVAYDAGRLDEGLSNAFGNKDMLVLK